MELAAVLIFFAAFAALAAVAILVANALGALAERNQKRKSERNRPSLPLTGTSRVETPQRLQRQPGPVVAPEASSKAVETQAMAARIQASAPVHMEARSAPAGGLSDQLSAAPGPSAPLEFDLTSAIQYAYSVKGTPISSEDREEWLEARRWGVTATDAKKLVKLNGLPSIQRAGLLERKLSGTLDRDFVVFQHGRDREPIIAEWARQEFGVVHNQYLMCGTNSMHLATPDGTGDGFIVEIKTSVKELLPTSKMYRDQLQWQLHVTNAERVLLIVENRHSLEREHMWIHRNEDRIRILATHADSFLEELHSRRR